MIDFGEILIFDPKYFIPMSTPSFVSQVDIIAIIRCQAHVRGFLQRKQFKWIISVRKIRQQTANEILQTEKTYHDALNHLVVHFKAPFDELGSKGAAVPPEIKTLFNNLAVYLSYSKTLLTGLKESIDKWDDHSRIGPVFKRLFPFYRSYIEYINGFDDLRDTVTRLRNTNSKFAAALRAREVNEQGVMDPVENYLITPVQRMPRYVLLLNQLLSNTWKTHPDYDDLMQAFKMVSDINEQVNSTKRTKENLDKLQSIYHQLVIKKDKSSDIALSSLSSTSLLKSDGRESVKDSVSSTTKNRPVSFTLQGGWDKQLLMDQKSRVFVKEGLVTETMIKGEPYKFFMILFNDLILWTKQKKNQLIFKAFNDLKGHYEVKLSMSPVEQVSLIHLKCDGFYRVFRGETEDETQKWFSALKEKGQTSQLQQVMAAADEIKRKNLSEQEKSHTFEHHLIQNRDAQQRKLHDDRRKPRGIRTTLKLTDLRFLEEVSRQRNAKIAEQEESIRSWQDISDAIDLSRFEVDPAQLKQMFDLIPNATYSSFSKMSQSLTTLGIPQQVPEIVFLGRQGSGKTSLISSLIGLPLPLESINRPLFIHLVNNPHFSSTNPSIWVRKDLHIRPKITRDAQVSDSEQLAKELLRRKTKEFSDIPIHVYLESISVFNCTLIDTPGLDAFQFHEDETSLQQHSSNSATPKSASSARGHAIVSSDSPVSVRALVYDVARQPHRQLVFVEECKNKGLMSSASGLATVVDPDLSRSMFVFTKFHHQLRDMWHSTQLNTYLDSAPSRASTFFVTLPSASSRSLVFQDSIESMQTQVTQAYARDLELMNMLQYDTQYAHIVGFHHFRNYILHWIHRYHKQAIPTTLTLITELKRTNSEQLSALQLKKNLTQNIKLRQISNAFAYDVVKLLQEVLFGSSHVEAKVFGQTLEDERYQLDLVRRDWLDHYHQLIVPVDHVWKNIAYYDVKLYGSSQIIRLFAIFQAIVEELQLTVLDPSEIASVFGQARPLYNTEAYLMVAHDIALSKAELILFPLVEQLCQRATAMIARLGNIATQVVASGNVQNGQYKREDLEIPLLTGYVRVQYEHYATKLGANCLNACAHALDQNLLYNLSKYATNLKLPTQRSEENQVSVITQLVTEMFKDISKHFVRIVTVQCYDILIARGVEDIAQSVQKDVAGLTDSELQKLFDVDSYKLAIDQKIKALTDLSSKTLDAESTYQKSIQVFIDELVQPQLSGMSRSNSFKKIPYESAQQIVMQAEAKLSTVKSSKTEKSKKSISTASQETTKPKPQETKSNGESVKSTEPAKKATPQSETKPVETKSAEPAKKATPQSETKPVEAKSTQPVKPLTDAQKLPTEAQKPVVDNSKQPSDSTKATIETSKTPSSDSTKDNTEQIKPEAEAKTPAVETAKQTGTQISQTSKSIGQSELPKKPITPPKPSESIAKQTSSSQETAKKPPIPQKPTETNQNTVDSTKPSTGTPSVNTAPNSAIVEPPLVKPSAAKVHGIAPVSQPKSSPGTESAKEVIPSNNLSNLKAAFESKQ